MKPNPMRENAISSLAAGAIAAVIYIAISSLQSGVVTTGVVIGAITALFVFIIIQLVRWLWIRRGE